MLSFDRFEPLYRGGSTFKQKSFMNGLVGKYVVLRGYYDTTVSNVADDDWLSFSEMGRLPVRDWCLFGKVRLDECSGRVVIQVLLVNNVSTQVVDSAFTINGHPWRDAWDISDWYHLANKRSVPYWKYIKVFDDEESIRECERLELVEVL